jgi:hypothetical protein
MSVLVAGCLSCSDGGLPEGFKVLTGEDCFYTALVIADVRERPGSRAIRSTVRHLKERLAGQCQILEAIEIHHFYEGALWSVSARLESHWEPGSWQLVPVNDLELIVLDELDHLRRFIAENPDPD